MSSEILTRRQILKATAAASLTAIPLLSERPHVAAQSKKSPDTQIVMPDPETREQFIEAFTSLIEDQMKPEGLELLGMKPILADIEETQGAWFIMEKSTVMVEDSEKPGQFMENSSVDYALHIHDPASPKDYMAAPFHASYVQYDNDPNSMLQMISFIIAPDGSLRKEADTSQLPFDSLKSVPERYFTYFDPTKTLWLDYPEVDPRMAQQIVSGGTPDFIKRDDGLLMLYHVILGKNGVVLYSTNIYKPEATQEEADKRGVFERSMKRLDTNLRMFRERLPQFNTPQA